jgi:hypothetical protein
MKKFAHTYRAMLSLSSSLTGEKDTCTYDIPADFASEVLDIAYLYFTETNNPLFEIGFRIDSVKVDLIS